MKKQADGSVNFYFRRSRMIGEMVFSLFFMVILISAAFRKESGANAAPEVVISAGLLILFIDRAVRFADKEPYVRLSSGGVQIKGMPFLEWKDVIKTKLKTGHAVDSPLAPEASIVFYTNREDPAHLQGKAFVLGSSFYVSLDLLSKNDRKEFLEETGKLTAVS